MLRTLLRPQPILHTLKQARKMTTKPSYQKIYFGKFEVSDQVFYSNTLVYALVNIKPLLPGHTLVIPHRHVSRLTDLTPEETTSLFSTVQAVQKMLAHIYFSPYPSNTSSKPTTPENSKVHKGQPTNGSFNIAIQDGADAGQSVPHVHCHIIPRLPDNGLGDEIYDRLAGEEGNVGGHQWDRELEGKRPVNGGKFPKIEDADRKARSVEVMNEEAAFYRAVMEELGLRGDR